MQTNHPNKASKRITLLGWFVLFSVLAHGLFFAIPASQKENRLIVQLTSPLQVTVISSRSASKPAQTIPPAQSKQIAITETQNIQFPRPAKSAKKPDRPTESKTVTKNITDIKPTRGSVILKNTLTESNTDPVKDDTKKRSTKSATLNHLRQQLKETIRARFTYPRMARRMGWEGLVGLSLHIEKDGSLNQIRIARSSGHKVLDDNAQKTIKSIGRLQLASNLTIQAADTEIEVLYRLTD
jgi:periplasmic protein TonB